MTSKFHDLLAFKHHKTIKFNDYHKGVFHPEKCFYLSDIILINVIKLYYLISTSKLASIKKLVMSLQKMTRKLVLQQFAIQYVAFVFLF